MRAAYEPRHCWRMKGRPMTRGRDRLLLWRVRWKRAACPGWRVSGLAVAAHACRQDDDCLLRGVHHSVFSSVPGLMLTVRDLCASISDTLCTVRQNNESSHNDVRVASYCWERHGCLCIDVAGLPNRATLRCFGREKGSMCGQRGESSPLTVSSTLARTWPFPRMFSIQR
jgi:hypothetical protein